MSSLIEYLKKVKDFRPKRGQQYPPFEAIFEKIITNGAAKRFSI
jgi:hypothetical protein